MLGPLTTWHPDIRSHLAHLRAAGRPRTTTELRHYQLAYLARDLAPIHPVPWAVPAGVLVAWLGSKGWKRNTVRSYGAAVRGFYTWGHATGLVDTDLAAQLPTVPQDRPRPRPATEGAYRAALLAATPRVALMVRLAGDLGLRRGEVCRVHADDVLADDEGAVLLVHGKGGQQRMVPIPDDLAGQLLARAGGGYVFPGGVGGHLGPERVGKLVADVLPAGVSMHQLRHRFATRAYLVDTDLPVVQALLGHASPATTMTYVAVPGEALRRTVLAVAS